MKNFLVIPMTMIFMATALLSGFSSCPDETLSETIEDTEVSVTEEPTETDTSETEKDSHYSDEGSRITDCGYNDPSMNDKNMQMFANVRDLSENPVYSPLSLNFTLGMCYQGSATSSYSEFLNYFGDNCDSTTDYYNNLMNGYNNLYGDMTIQVANSIWTKAPVELNQDYVRSVSSSYNAACGMFEDSEESVNEINGWVGENTNNLIREIVSRDMLAQYDNIIVNTVYFNGQWSEPFYESSNTRESFNNANGSTSTVDMMHGGADIYYENDFGVGFAKHYSNGMYFVAVLPNETDYSISDFDFDDFIESGDSNYDISISMPKFTAESTFDLVDPLRNMGFSDVFSSSADFSNMSNTPMAISSVIQKVYIDVNEYGTEAAAATEVSFKISAAMDTNPFVEITLDRPFIYMIYDSNNNEILFVGAVDNM